MKVELQKVEDVGSCNECQRRDQPLVVTIDLRTIGVRLCPDCLETLGEKLSDLINHEKTGS